MGKIVIKEDELEIIQNELTELYENISQTEYSFKNVFSKSKADSVKTMMAMFDEAEKILQVMSNIIYKTGEFLELTIDGFVMLDKHKKEEFDSN